MKYHLSINRSLRVAFILLFSLLSIVVAQDEEDDQFEFDDDEFDIEDIDIEGIDEFEFDEGEFDELLEEFELEEEEGVYEEGTPRSFGIGLNLGTTMPFGANLTDRFNSGMNFGLTVTSPIGMYIGPFEIIFGGELSYSSMSGISNDSNPNPMGYTIMNFLGTAKTKIVIFDVSTGIGLSPSSAPSTLDDNYGETVSKSVMSIVVDVGYRLPIKMDPISLDLRFRAQESLGVPGSEEGTSDMIGFGLVVNYKM